MSSKFYITTAIDYVNGKPHLGHALEKIQADVIARWQRMQAKDVYFLTGVDENSLKNVQAAEKENLPTRELVDRNSAYFQELCDTLNISNNDFVRTVEDFHFKGSKKLWESCKKEDIYKKSYKGLYCVGCEAFLTDKDLVDGKCPEHQTEPETVEEENYFFKLSNYQKKLEKLIESDEYEVVPKSKKNEVLSFIKMGLEDFSISRSKERAKNWGVPVPGDERQVIYVWFDALANYITALGYGGEEKLMKQYWPADVHLIGKGIIRFHAIYWPAMLLSAGVPLPKKLMVHGYITIEGQKMSKSLGNVIDPQDMVTKYGVEPLRYYLLRDVPSLGDGDFSIRRLEERYNSDLANGLGNLLSRVVALCLKLDNLEDSTELKKASEKAWGSLEKAFEKLELNEALNAVWHLIAELDGYIEKNKPWELVKNDPEKAKKVLGSLAESLRQIAWLLIPFMPETADQIFGTLGLDPAKEKQKTLKEGREWSSVKELKLKKREGLFPRI